MTVFGIHRKHFFGGAACVALVALIAFGLISTMASSAQSQTQTRSRGVFEFESSSVKLSSPDPLTGFVPLPGPGQISNTFLAKNVTTLMLIGSAYGIPTGAEDSRISGAPAWLSSEKYDVEAKIDGFVLRQVKAMDLEHRQLVQQRMLQMLLVDRFNLAVHKETKDLPLYSLVIAKDGPKLQEPKLFDPAQTNTSGPAGQGARGIGMTGSGGPMTGVSATVADLARVLSALLGRPVLDKTGLTGTYDFTLQWTPDKNHKSPYIYAPNGEPSPVAQDPGGTTIFTALQEQLGLKLEPGKRPMEIIVIDHVERPSGN